MTPRVRSICWTLATGLLVTAVSHLTLASSAAADDCRAAVETAFEKQRVSKGYRFSAAMPSAEGTTRMTVDYLPPDRMYQKVEAPGHPAPVETIAIQRWAWGTMGGGWEELQPQFAQSIIAHMRTTLINPPKITAVFTCLGKVKFDDKEVLAYRADQPGSEAAASGAPELARTVYVDPASGLPVANIVGRTDGKDAPVFDGRYSYPDDIQIEAPIGGHDIAPNAPTKN
ncbi:MAG: hypothetical protein H6876_08990 [Hyphomicrobiaceae bacterium]|nr:hypothetical protein [Hyphomicrobiaceae bacterium]MCC0008243.1 hypothetical protein [Hyphomicrobiaceae bacterium]